MCQLIKKERREEEAGKMTLPLQSRLGNKNMTKEKLDVDKVTSTTTPAATLGSFFDWKLKVGE